MRFGALSPLLATLALGVVLGLCPPLEAQVRPTSDAVPVATRNLTRGTVLERSDFRFEDAADSTEVGPIGWSTRRIVKEGEPLRPPTIAPTDVVQAGDNVQVVWSDGSMELRMSGRAMNSAAVGESVNVRVDMQRRFSGIATGAGLVRLDTPESDERR